jgi:hypothetical protein
VWLHGANRRGAGGGTMKIKVNMINDNVNYTYNCDSYRLTTGWLKLFDSNGLLINAVATYHIFMIAVIQ